MVLFHLNNCEKHDVINYLSSLSDYVNAFFVISKLGLTDDKIDKVLLDKTIKLTVMKIVVTNILVELHYACGFAKSRRLQCVLV